MKSLAEISAVLANDETRIAFKEAAEKRSQEREVDEYIAGLSDDQLDGAIEEAKTANEAVVAQAEVEKVAADYYTAGQIMAQGFREELGESLSKVAENATKLDEILSIFKSAGVGE